MQNWHKMSKKFSTLYLRNFVWCNFIFLYARLENKNICSCFFSFWKFLFYGKKKVMGKKHARTVSEAIWGDSDFWYCISVWINNISRLIFHFLKFWFLGHKIGWNCQEKEKVHTFLCFLIHKLLLNNNFKKTSVAFFSVWAVLGYKYPKITCWYKNGNDCKMSDILARRNICDLIKPQNFTVFA